MVEVIFDDDHVIFKIKNDGEKDLKRFYTIDYFKFIGLNPEIFITPKRHLTKGGYFEENSKLTVPYRYFVNFVENNPITFLTKSIKIPNTYSPNDDFKYKHESPKQDELKDKEEMELRDKEEMELRDKEEMELRDKKEMELKDQEDQEKMEKIDREEMGIRYNKKENMEFEEKGQDSNVEIITIIIKLDNKIQSKSCSLYEILRYNKEFLKDDIELNTNGLYYNEVENIFRIRKEIKLEIFINEIYRINGKFIVIKDNDNKNDINIDNLDLTMMKNTLLTKYIK